MDTKTWLAGVSTWATSWTGTHGSTRAAMNKSNGGWMCERMENKKLQWPDPANGIQQMG